MRKKPYDSEELFEAICNKLKEKGLMPKTLDYSLPCRDKYPVDSYEVAIRNNLDYGGSEGIYLTLRLYLCGEEKPFGTFKTLGETREDMIEMATLLANFVTEFRDFVDENIDDFTWRGFEVYPMKEDGTAENGGWECAKLEWALERKNQLLEKHDRVFIRDNKTRKITEYEKFRPFKTDDCQWLLHKDGNAYTFAEVRYVGTGYAAYQGSVDLDDISEGDRIEYAIPYYDPTTSGAENAYEELKRVNGNAADQILAECIFEQWSNGSLSKVTATCEDEEDAMALLDEYVNAFVRRNGGAA